MTTQTAPLDASCLFDDYAHDQIRIRARILVKQSSLPPHAQEDVQQDMYLELVKAQKRFDPARGAPNTFISRVLDRFCKHFVRREGTKMRTRIPEQPCSDIGEEFDLDNRTVGEGMLADAVRAEWQQQVRAVIAELPPELQQLCETLVSRRDKTAMAEQLGIARSSLYRRIAKLREVFRLAKIGAFPESDGTDSAMPQK